MTCIDATDIIQALGGFYTPEEIDDWLDAPHKLLGGRTPTALIMSGHADEVMRIVQQLRDGTYT